MLNEIIKLIIQADDVDIEKKIEMVIYIVEMTKQTINPIPWEFPFDKNDSIPPPWRGPYVETTNEEKPHDPRERIYTGSTTGTGGKYHTNSKTSGFSSYYNSPSISEEDNNNYYGN